MRDAVDVTIALQNDPLMNTTLTPAEQKHILGELCRDVWMEICHVSGFVGICGWSYATLFLSLWGMCGWC